MPELLLLATFLVAVVPLAPTEAFVISSGLLAAQGELSLPVVIAVTAVGCLISDLINYRVGYKFGPLALKRFERRKGGTPTAVRWVRARLHQHGEPVLVAARFVPGGGIAGAVLAGTFRMGPRRFTVAAVIGSVLWAAYASLLGYTGGHLTTDPVLGLLLSIAMAAVLSVMVALLVRRAQRRAEEAERAEAELLAGLAN
ncbi:membrane protein DedA with SNARE-associated domain [Crossiella equi]|uniref:Membrane protein DedA with SNARE-associated domain n=1 Tax=Crossiella equi TaxID=130796 RepID=A0ABS5AI03_9PSEU|nr:DedA family protein [Crossiella equi]MBP2475315.1 membrane protein DedA with SNARE-associated domain [Crossiella equi]